MTEAKLWRHSLLAMASSGFEPVKIGPTSPCPDARVADDDAWRRLGMPEAEGAVFPFLCESCGGPLCPCCGKHVRAPDT